MRFKSVLIGAGLAFLASGAAYAQTNYQSVQPSGGYVYTGNQNANTSQVAPLYNTNIQPMIKGKNTPSYSFKNSTQPYNNFGTNVMKSGPMSLEEADRMRALRDAQAYADAARDGSAGQQPNNAGALQTMYGQLLPGQQAQQQPQRKKRLVYREDANPLRTPPRLFNPDQ